MNSKHFGNMECHALGIQPHQQKDGLHLMQLKQTKTNGLMMNVCDFCLYKGIVCNRLNLVDQLSGENDKIREADKEEINTYKFKGLTIMEATRRLEQFRTRVRIKGDY
jgi:precorrin-6B methylase 1